MRFLILLITFALFACTPTPAHPSSPPHNRAIDYAHMMVVDAGCVPLATLGNFDSALCDTGMSVLYCVVANGNAPKCGLVGDFHPPKETKPDDAPNPATTTSTPTAVDQTPPPGVAHPKPEPGTPPQTTTQPVARKMSK
jgi:hypothetical protein